MASARWLVTKVTDKLRGALLSSVAFGICTCPLAGQSQSQEPLPGTPPLASGQVSVARMALIGWPLRDPDLGSRSPRRWSGGQGCGL